MKPSLAPGVRRVERIRVDRPRTIAFLGEEMRIYVVGDPAEDTALEKSWGEIGPILNNGGDKVRLSSLRDILIDCYAYGTGAC